MKYLETNTLSNFDLQRKLGNVKDFRGVFSHDSLPKSINENEYSIVNLQNKNQPGSHWVLIVNRSPEKYVYYFDSFGIAPSEIIAKYLKTSGKAIMFNNRQLQENISNRCGYFCAFIVTKVDSGMSFYDALFSLFQHPTEKNEKMVKQ